MGKNASIDRDTLYDEVWRIPMIELGQTYGVSRPTIKWACMQMGRAFDGFSGMFSVLCALRLASMLVVRPGELRRAEWAQFDLDKVEWRDPVTRTQPRHLVPLATLAVAILRELQALTGKGCFVFRRPFDVAYDERRGNQCRTQTTGL